MRAGRRASSILIVLAALGALGYANWYAANSEIEVSPLTPPAATAAMPVPGTTLDSDEKTVALGDLQETLTRPLFNSSRRPEQPPAAPVTGPATVSPPAPSAAPPENLQLIGVMRKGPGSARALIRVEHSGVAGWYNSGADVAGWHLSEIADDHVIVESGGQRSRLALYPEKSTKASPPTAP